MGRSYCEDDERSMKILIGFGGENDSDVKVIRGYNDFFY